MGTGSYNCKPLVFSMHSEKVIAGWTCHFWGFWHALYVPEGNVYSQV